MKKLIRVFGLVLAFFGIISLAACSGAGVEAKMEAVATSTKVTITSTFVANSKLDDGSAVPTIKQYSYDEDDTEVSDNVSEKVTFSDSKTVATTEFTGLSPKTKYLFKMYITYDETDTLVAKLDVETLADGDVIQITTTDEFMDMGDNPTANYQLMNDLNFTDVEFTTPFTASTKFEGTFDGNGKTISNVTLTSASYIGLFGYTDGATIKNLKVSNVKADFVSSGRSSAKIGALIGEADGTVVRDVTISGVDISMSANSGAEIYTGGVVGYAYESTFKGVSASDVAIEYTRMRTTVYTGLFAGMFSGDSAGNNAITYTKKTTYEKIDEYYEVAAEEAAVTSDSDFVLNDYYTLSGDVYTRQTKYEAGAKYYTLTVTERTIDESDFAGGTYYVKDTQAILCDGCMASGSIDGALYYASTSTSKNQLSNVGGFAGTCASKSLLTNSYVTADISITRTTGSTFDYDYDLSVGGFIGIAGSSANITKCFADSIVNVSSGSEVTSETSADDVAKLYTQSMLGDYGFVRVSAFIGRLNKYIANVTDCYYVRNSNHVYAATTRLASADEISKFDKADKDDKGNDISDVADYDTSVDDIVVGSLNYSVTATTYYTLSVTPATGITSDTDFSVTLVYTLDGTTYKRATSYTEGADYYTVEPTKTAVDSSYDFDKDSVYTWDGSDFTRATSFTANKLYVTYLSEGDAYASVYDGGEARVARVYEFTSATADLSAFDAFVANYLKTLDK